MISRRSFLRRASGAALAAALPPVASDLLATDPPLVSGFAFTSAERAALRAAANQVIPPFRNDRLSFRGAGEEGAVEYVETLLTAFDHDPPRIYASASHGTHLPGFPERRDPGFTECEGGHLAVADGWLPLPREKEAGWRAAVARFQQGYRVGLGLLERDSHALFASPFDGLPLGALQTVLLEAYDGLNLVLRFEGVYTAGGGEPALVRTFGLPEDPRAVFMNLLVSHVMEAIYGDPIYGGNKDRVGWKLVGFGGPRHPEGYFPEELEAGLECDLGLPINAEIVGNLLGTPRQGGTD
jgi:hypothetical protein